MSPVWSLAAVSLAAGAIMMAVFRLVAKREAIRTEANHIQARLLEFWLYVDEPALVWSTWAHLLKANARLVRLMLVPLAVLAIPAIPLFVVLDAIYGYAPLPAGKPALVTVGTSRPLDRTPSLAASNGIAVEDPPVRVFSAREVSWRIRPERPLTGLLRCTLGGKAVEKRVTAGGGLYLLSTGRGWFGLSRDFWMEIDYPPAEVRWLGLEAHWSVWFLLFSAAGALLWIALPRRA